MFKCKICNEEFLTGSKLGGHVSSCHYEVTRYSKSKAKYNKPGCIVCSKPVAYHKNKYCSSACNGKQLRQKQIEKLIAGKAGSKDALKSYLLETRGNKCEWCGIGPEWCGKPLILQMDHIDGNPQNHTIKNTRILCPNCHTQTDNWSCGNRKKNANQYTHR